LPVFTDVFFMTFSFVFDVLFVYRYLPIASPDRVHHPKRALFVKLQARLREGVLGFALKCS